MKKILYTIGILALIAVSANIVNATIVTVDSYNESNGDGYTLLSNDSFPGTYRSQSFTNTNSITLDSVKVFLHRNGSATGNITVYIYNITGTYGTDSLPTGSPIATSDVIDASTISTTVAGNPYTFTFSGAQRITLSANTKYALAVNYNDSGAPSYLSMLVDSSASSASGDASFSTDGTSWSASTADRIFYVYGDDSGGSPVVVNTSGQKMLMGMSY